MGENSLNIVCFRIYIFFFGKMVKLLEFNVVVYFSQPFPDIVFVKVFVALLSMRTLLMKSYERPAIGEFIICAIFEIIHVVGVAILFFVALPGNIYSVLRGLGRLGSNSIKKLTGIYVKW